MIHPTAIIHPKAKVDATTRVGPYAVIDEQVEIGPHCLIGPHVHLTGVTTIGVHNQFHTGCVVGDAPQDLKYDGAPTRLRVGDHNVFREHVTIHRSTKVAEETVIGSHNFLMVNSHVGHNCVVGNHVILANGVLLAGHVSVDDRAFLSGNCLVHQFVRVGAMALMRGGAAISQDLPPYCIARGDNGICGLNVIGLRRAGITSAERIELKQIYRLLFLSGKNVRSALDEAQKKFSSASAKTFLDFIASSKRGICRHTGSRDVESSEEE